MFASLLIANRGEIAVRIVRTAKRLGIRTIAVYSHADRDALHVEMADEAHEIGPAAASESYLDGERIIAAARAAGAEAIHPGYGFLSENAGFAEACARAGLVFVGPPPEAMRVMGLKDEAKTLMQKAGVPVVPGYHGARQEPDFLREKAYEVGYPVLVKAAAGGGGKGMRRIERALDFDDALAGARREAKAAFGDERVLIEKFVPSPRHIEMQVFADRHGGAVHLFERDCSLQRRHQKIVEEAPAPGMTVEMRAAMGDAAVAAARAVGYVGAGTVEFIADATGGLRPDRFFFMEMNTRLQVEHPVTEAITGLDLVEWQLRVAAGEPLPQTQDEIAIDGHAVEIRLYAEDSENGFLPSTGTLEAFDLSDGEGVRIDTGVRQNDRVTPHYDPMLAKVIAHAENRDGALDRLAAALGDSLVAGPCTNLGFLRRLLAEPGFRAGEFDTGLVDRHLAALIAHPPGTRQAAVALGALRLLEREAEDLAARAGFDPTSPWSASDGFQLGPARRQSMELDVDGALRSIELEWEGGEAAVVVPSDTDPWPQIEATLVDAQAGVYVLADGRQTFVRIREVGTLEMAAGDAEAVILAPMHGRVVTVDVEEGAPVARGERLAVLEAMKMEHTLTAPHAGTVGEITAIPGAQVGQGEKLMVIRPDD